MSDWRPGDLVLCVNARPIRCSRGIHNGKQAPKEGAVSEVVRVQSWYCGCETIWTVAGVGIAKRFRKINPHKADEQDAETIRLLNGERIPA